MIYLFRNSYSHFTAMNEGKETCMEKSRYSCSMKTLDKQNFAICGFYHNGHFSIVMQWTQF